MIVESLIKGLKDGELKRRTEYVTAQDPRGWWGYNKAGIHLKKMRIAHQETVSKLKQPQRYF